jgi:predicted nucleotide-binding protein
MKPRLFLGSASEDLKFAYAAQANLEHCAQVTVWNQGVFQISRTTMESLVSVLKEADFGLFLFTPNDVAIIRSSEKQVVRDNVLFELGLFIGGLGRERSFIILPAGYGNLNLPTDLLGVNAAKFDANRGDKNWRAALGPACYEVQLQIERLGAL